MAAALPQVLVRAAGGGWLAFDAAVTTLEARRPAEVAEVLRRLDEGLADGLWVAGFLAYEAAAGIDPAFATRPRGPLPLARFGLYREPRRLADAELPAAGAHRLGDWRLAVPAAAHAAAVAAIRERIARGETYQVNFSVRLAAEFSGDPWGLCRALWRAQPTEHAAWVDLDRHALCSASPELFFELAGSRLASRPMKGTGRRGRTTAEDAVVAAALAASPKDRAENLMIVDMVRNDLGRVAKPGSVVVERLFELERYPTLWQLTSTVAAETAAPLSELLGALFPAASITGAPKVAAMAAIRDLEAAPRGAYTGAIGWAAPDRRARFNVAIRTVTVDRAAGAAEYGTGGGVVWDSTAEAELEECRTKAFLLTRARPEFELLETLLWEPASGYFLLDRHLARLADSAAYFDRPCDTAAVRAALLAAVAAPATASRRVRLLLAADGGVTVSAEPLAPAPPSRRVALATTPVDSSDPFLFHKTTRRETYDRARAAAGAGADDVLLWNERGELTESTVANLVIERHGRRITPPLSCGLLPGTFREELLAHGAIVEEPIRRRDLDAAAAIFLVSSLRRWMRAELLAQPAGRRR